MKNEERQNKAASVTASSAKKETEDTAPYADDVKHDGAPAAMRRTQTEAEDERHAGTMAAGAPIVSRRTAWLTLAGLIVGGALGCVLGIAFGRGRLNIAGLAPFAAGGVTVSGFIFASFFGALFGLAAALFGTATEAAETTATKPHGEGETQHGEMKHDKAEQGEMQHDKPSFIQQLPIYGSIALALFMAYTLYVIASSGYGSGKPSDQSNRVTWNQKNAARVGGASDMETAAYVLQTVYPSTRPENSPRVVINVAADWRAALAATPLIARPVNAALVIAGEGASAVASSSTEQIAGNDAATIADTVDARRAQATGSVSANVIVVSADADYRFALPAGAYSARTGTPVLFVTKDGVPNATAGTLQRRGGHARIFVLGSTDIVSANVFDALKQFGAVTRIEGGDYFANAVRFAEFRDEAADFGWGYTGGGKRQWSTHNTILVNPERWQDVIMAAHLAGRGKSGPLLFTERNRLPAVVDNFLWRQRPAYAMTPAEGPFNHVWVVGSFDRIAYGTQAWADYSQEIEQYMTRGDSALSGYEALGIGWLIFSIASAFWIVFHSIKLMPDMMPMMKAAWAIFALLLGPIALWLYILNYHRRAKMGHDGMTVWRRPMWLQTVSATVMMFSFDMLLMCLAVFVLAYFFGFPIIRFNGSLYWLGSSMFLMMVFMYLFALLLMMLVFHTPMTMHEKKINSYGKAFIVGLPIMVATMTVESVGMMPTMWWQQMLFLPNMQMPTEDELTMWTTLLFSVFIGFLVVLPFNYWLVKRGKKMGGM